MKNDIIKGIYLPDPMPQELRAEAARLERPMSWVMQCAWRIARERIQNFDKERK